MKRPVQKKIAYIVVASALRVLGLLPFEISCKIGEWAGYLLFKLSRKHRLIAYNNLKLSFPQKGEEEIWEITEQVFLNIGIMLAEVAAASVRGESWIKKQVSIEGREHLEEALRKGKGVLLLTGHLGNWEYVALGIGREYPLSFVARSLDNEYLNDFITGLRTMFGSEMISNKRAAYKIMDALKRKRAVGILMDQNVLWDHGIFVDFFGRPACTTPVIPVVALKTGAPVIPAFAIRVSPGRIKIIIKEEVRFEPTGDKKEDTRRYTQLLTKVIESNIRDYPDQWFWVHRRWKSKEPSPQQG